MTSEDLPTWNKLIVITYISVRAVLLARENERAKWGFPEAVNDLGSRNSESDLDALALCTYKKIHDSKFLRSDMIRYKIINGTHVYCCCVDPLIHSAWENDNSDNVMTSHEADLACVENMNPDHLKLFDVAQKIVSMDYAPLNVALI